MKNEQWTEQILASINGLQPAAADEALFSKIKSRISSAEFVSPKTVWLAAASIVVLLAANAIIIRKSATQTVVSDTVSIATAFDQSNQLY